MAWIKRNLFFLVGLLVALALMGLGGWYFYTQYTAEGQSATEIEGQYDLLGQLGKKSPHPGKPGGPVDNVKAAQEQKAQMTALAEKFRASFQPVSKIDAGGNFQRQLDSSVQQLRSAAKDAGVNLPSVGDYYFTFQAERRMLNLEKKDYPTLLGYLAEIKAICEVLFSAKVNSINSLQREMIPGLETNGPDYLPPGGAASPNSLVEMTPYKVSFNCFSGELATILGSFASSPNGFIVKYVDVEPAASVRAGPPLSFPTPGPNAKPKQFLNENLLGVTLFIEVVKPLAAKQ